MMDCTTTYTNCNSINLQAEAKLEAFHKRLRQLYPCVDDVTKLPQTWSSDYKAPSLGLTCDNLGCYVRCNSRRDDDEKSAAAIRSDNPIPPACFIYYFEITFISKGREGKLGIGLTPNPPHLSKQPGWAKESYGYHADDGHKFNGDAKQSGDTKGLPFGPQFTTDDVIGCGYNLVEGKVFFTKNGLNLGPAFEDVPNNLLYPTVGLKTNGEEIYANFGQNPFKYDVEQDLRSLRKNMTFKISNFPVEDFGIWQTTLHKLVQSWLIQNSYPNTAEAFTKAAKIEYKENSQRIHQRNKIQQLVLNGNIGEAIRLTNRLCPNLLQNNQNLMFALGCRQFIELISGTHSDNQSNFNCNTLSDATNSNESGHINNNNTSNNNTTSNNSNHNHLEQEILFVNDINSGTSSSSNNNLPKTIQQSSFVVGNNCDQSITTTTATNGSIKNHNNNSSTDSCLIDDSVDENLNGEDQKLARLLEFGRELNDYLHKLDKLNNGKNEFNEKMFRDAISLIAFTDPTTSTYARPILDPNERETISQLLNTSIVKSDAGQTYRPLLEEVMNHLRRIVRLNDSHGGWLVDKLF